MHYQLTCVEFCKHFTELFTFHRVTVGNDVVIGILTERAVQNLDEHSVIVIIEILPTDGTAGMWDNINCLCINRNCLPNLVLIVVITRSRLRESVIDTTNKLPAIVTYRRASISL